MNKFQHVGFAHHKIHRCWQLFVIIFGILLFPTLGSAQNIVVSNFSGQSKKTSINVKKSLTNALSKRGIRILSFEQYLRRAKRHRISTRNALNKNSIQILADDMSLDGVVVGALRGTVNKQYLEIQLINYLGKTVFVQTYPIRRRSLPRRTANKVSRLFSGALRNIAIARASYRRSTTKPRRRPRSIVKQTPHSRPMVSQAPVSQAPVSQAPVSQAPVSQAPVSQAPVSQAPVSQAPVSQVPVSQVPVSQVPVSQALVSQAPTQYPTATQPSYPVPQHVDRETIGSVPNISLAAGMSGNLRSGLEPTHRSGLIPGIWVGGRAFLDSVLHTTFLKDIGVGGYYNKLLGLEYGPKDSGLTWGATQTQWQGEIVYRLAFNHLAIAPAFLIRAGFGTTVCKIETDSVLAISAKYRYPYGMMDIYLTIFPSLLRFYVSGGYMYLTQAKLVSGDIEALDWSGSGFTIKSGVDLEIISSINISFGYELNRFMLHKGREDRSDMYQTFLLQVGWRLN